MTNATYIPLDAKESAFLEDSNTLLPKAIYKRVAEFIRDAIRTQPAHKVSMNESRSHHAISIDGERGTGKTSVLVNLKRYVELEHPDLLADIHILNPVDPTLLEDGESLFLHMIVAAVLQDRQVQEAQRLRPEQARELQQCLERLGQGLESAELQVDRHGMDKIRALYGNRLLADSVQDFFRAALKLLDKKLLVLPIDDVDTSLNRAFENLEIIRRYLATPYVLTIVSGDRSLYNQVTWRDFHGRLTKDSAHLVDDAYGTALDLANEYQRKILPLPRRLTMPAVSQYWQDRDITLGKDGMPLANFITWLEIFIAGPVNGLEASRLALPISSIRALTQLINHCGELIPELPEGIRSAESDLQVRRRWQMPTVPQGVLEDFHKKHQELGKEKKREYATAYRLFSEELARQTPANYFLNDKLALKWVQQLTDYFRFEPQAGGVYLALLATNHWQSWAAGNSEVRRGGVFDTPLFQPLLHTETEFKQFDKQDDLSDWTRQLQNRLPESWLAKLEDQHTLLPYPAAELGINTTISWKYWDDIEVQIQDVEKQGNALFLLSLLMQHNFYTRSKRTMMLNIGRVFEIIIASLVGPVELADLQRIMQQAPFFSTSALAPTKVVDFNDVSKAGRGATTQENSQESVENRPEYVLDAIEDHLSQLQQEITTWRKKHKLDGIKIAPWLVYKVFNKVFSQLASTEIYPNGMTVLGKALEMVGMVFCATWSAFGSFEKGLLFGLPDVIATVNLNSPYNFENNEHYRINVGPLAPTIDQLNSPDAQVYQERSCYGNETRAVSYYLADHPLRKWWELLPQRQELNEAVPYKVLSKSTTIIRKTNIEARKWLCAKLGEDLKNTITQRWLLGVMEGKSIDNYHALVEEMRSLYPDSKEFEILEKVASPVITGKA